MSDTLTMLGKLAPPEARRDAVHVAVVAVESGQEQLLFPGDRVSIRGGKAYRAVISDHQGIVDPFLLNPVQRGQWFWLFLKPGTITSLRHVWTHPDFAEEGEGPAIEAVTIQKAVSRAWMEAWCNEKGADVNSFLAALPEGQYCFGQTDYPYEWDQFPPEFWTHYKVLTGREKPTVEANFRCAC